MVAFDGPDAAGKSTLAQAVAAQMHRPAVVVSLDGGHNPREVRNRRGELSPDGYYADSFDLDALIAECLTPFRSGAATIRTALFEYRTDTESRMEAAVGPDAVLLFDGVFLQRPELVSMWDLRVYLHVPESVSLTRAIERDLAVFENTQAIRLRYTQRYLPGQALYRKTSSPLERADIVIDNTDPEHPRVVKWDGRDGAQA